MMVIPGVSQAVSPENIVVMFDATLASRKMM
jgi:hypothetical protein